MPPTAPATCYILAGPETGSRDAFITDLADTCSKIDGAPPERHRLYASETPVESLLGLLRNGSLFSSRRLVEYRNAELVSAKADVTALEEYIKSPAADAILLVMTESYSVAKAIEAAAGQANKKMFWELRDSEKPSWIRQRLSKDRLTIEDHGVDAMLELVENETSALGAACTLLAACFPEGSRLGADDVEAALSKTRQEDAFSLFDRMAGADLSTALSVLDTLLADRQSDATQIIAALVWSFRKTERLQAALASGLSPDEAFRREKITSKTGQRKFRSAMQRYSAEECARITRAASETEGILRGGLPSLFARPLLHLLVRSAMVQKGRGLILSGWKEQEYYRLD